MKKTFKALIFPHIAVVLILIPTSTVSLVLAVTCLPEKAPARIASYVLSFYALTVLCAGIPKLFEKARTFKTKNRYVSTWTSDARLRMKVTLSAGVIWNSTYALLQLGLAIFHRSTWYYSMGAYYLSLAAMRTFLAHHTFRHDPGKDMALEWRRYRLCGRIFLTVSIALSGMIFFMIRGERTVRHSEITTIALATYTFASLAMAIVNAVRYRRSHSPVFSASKSISLASCLVSMLTLENTMLKTFQRGEMSKVAELLLMALSGAAVSLFILITAFYMTTKARRNIKYLEKLK